MVTICSINPASGEAVGEYQEMSVAEVEGILGAAASSQREWAGTGFAHRAECLRRAAALLRRRAGDYARLMALEMGKPLAAGRAEAEKCAWVCDYYAEQGADFLAAEEIVKSALAIAADIDIYTNTNIVVEVLECSK